MDQAKDLLLQCIDGLVYAHEQSVIHGDIKPANVMVTGKGTVKITDFGVAKVMSEETTTTYVAQGIRRLGSLTYIAPEILRGAPRSAKSDIFSLGVLGYLLLTAHHPFYSTHPSGLFGMRHTLLSPDEALEPTSFRRDLPPVYARVISGLVAKNPEDRYESLRLAYEQLANIGLECPRCHYQNPLSSRFCNQCGSALKRDEYEGKSAEELRVIAFRLNKLGQYEEALRVADVAIKKNPRSARIHQNKGYSLSSLEQYEKALESFREGLRHLDMTGETDRIAIAQILTNMSFCHERLGNYREARKVLIDALKMDPYSAKAEELLQRGAYKGYWTNEEPSQTSISPSLEDTD